MAALPTIPDVLRCSVVGHTAIGTRWANVLHVKKDAGMTTSAAIALVHTQIGLLYQSAGFGAGKLGWATMGHPLAGVEAVRYTPLYNNLATTINSLVIAGAGTGDALPSDTCLVISWRSDSRGPRYRGRSYWPSPSELTNGADGRCLPASAATFAAASLQFVANLATALVPLQVASYKYATSAPVTATSVDTRWDRQRRRAK